jgi:hypothetical protein
VEGVNFLDTHFIYMDASAVTSMSRHALEPMTGCPCWVKREVRNTVVPLHPIVNISLILTNNLHQGKIPIIPRKGTKAGVNAIIINCWNP